MRPEKSTFSIRDPLSLINDSSKLSLRWGLCRPSTHSFHCSAPMLRMKASLFAFTSSVAIIAH